jgi:hypothetical protein
MNPVSTLWTNPTYKFQATQYTTQWLKAMLHSSTCVTHSPLEAGRSSARQEIPAFYGSPRFIYFTEAHGSYIQTTAPARPCHNHKRSSPCPPPLFLKAHFNIILPSMPVFSNWSLSLRFPHQDPVWPSALTYTCYTVHHILLDLITWIIFGGD